MMTGYSQFFVFSLYFSLHDCVSEMKHLFLISDSSNTSPILVLCSFFILTMERVSEVVPECGLDIYVLKRTVSFLRCLH